MISQRSVMGLLFKLQTVARGEPIENHRGIVIYRSKCKLVNLIGENQVK